MIRRRLITVGAVAVLAASLAACTAGGGTPSTPVPTPQTLPFQSTPPAGDSMSGDSMDSMSGGSMKDGAMGGENPMSLSGSIETAEPMGTPGPMTMSTPEPMMTGTPQPMGSEDSMMNDESMTPGDSMMQDEAMAPEGSMAEDQSMGAGGSAMDSDLEGRYIDYSPEAFQEAAEGGRPVLFFMASWCPTCIASEADLKANLERLPEDVTILKVDFDSASDLKSRYMVTHQHTFIQVDAEGNQVSRWDGGGYRDLVANLK